MSEEKELRINFKTTKNGKKATIIIECDEQLDVYDLELAIAEIIQIQGETSPQGSSHH